LTRVLIIDDEIEKAQPLIRYFREICEWATEIAGGPDQALDEFLPTAEACPFDVIILDVMMEPGKAIPLQSTNNGRDTGLRLLELIVKRFSQRVNVIIYTARTDLDDLKKDDKVAEYVAAYFQKPSEVRDIVKAIKRLVERCAS
jgi:CheY-like chemotaxis protein